jgi:TonB family protein
VSANTEPERPTAEKPRGSRFAGLLGLAEVLRTLPERMRRPEALIMVMALFASVGAHMPPYMGLGALADHFAAHPPPRPKLPPSEVSFELNDPGATPPAEPVHAPPEKSKPVKPKPEKKVAPEMAKPEPELPKKAAPEPPNLKITDQAAAALPETPKADPRKQSITQKSEDPDVAPPPDAKFLAEQNRRVEEETVARVTDLSRDDPEPTPSAPQAPGDEQSGDSTEDDPRPSRAAVIRPSTKPTAQAPASEPAAPAPGQRAAEAREAQTSQPEQPLVIQDPLGGSFALVPSQPAREAQSAQEGRAGRAGAPGVGPSLKVSWQAFEQTFGAEQLAQDRLPREPKRRGAGREKRWSEFRAAIENYVAGVKPGNSTALNAAADPFAAYLAAFHRNLHMEFAHDFLGSLPVGGELGDPNLVTKVEIVVNPDGTLDRVGVVGSSGNMMYDFGAFNAVQRGAPYPPTPEKIRSPDGRVYVRWALHRNESQCGTWNAEPYILRNPPRSPNSPPEDNVSPFRGPARGTEQGKPEGPAGPGQSVTPGETLGQRGGATPAEGASG